MLFPNHRLPFCGSLFSFLNKRPSFLQSQLIIRWIALSCIAIAFIWFGGPLLADSLGLGPFGVEYPPPNTALAPHLERPSNPPPRPTKGEQHVWDLRKNEVRNAFKHAWSGYKSIAYPDDELLSISGGSSNKLRSFFIHFILSIEFFYIQGLTVGA